MKKEDYWNLFWLSGMPEAWMMSRPLESRLFPPEATEKTLGHARSDLPQEVREMEQKRSEQAAAELGKRPDHIG